MTYIYQDSFLIGPKNDNCPDFRDYDQGIHYKNALVEYLSTLPRYPVQGQHSWINGQEVGEGEFRIEVNPNLEVEFAIPIHKETNPEQSDSEREGLIKIRNYFGEHDKTTFEHWAYNFLNKLLTTNQ